ncbi:MAG: hypothetical protein Fur0018_00980 [Anaerolineales bacterium]
MSQETIILALTDRHTAQLIAQGTLVPAGYRYHIIEDPADLSQRVNQADILLVDKNFLGTSTFQTLQAWHQAHPQLRTLMVTGDTTPEFLLAALRAGVSDILRPPLRTSALLAALGEVLARRNAGAEKAIPATPPEAQNQIQAFERLAEIGKMVTSALDLDAVLNSAVDAAVALTDAQEGNLLLVDPETNELFVRAERNLGDEFARVYRTKVEDSLAGKVIQSGEPLLISRRGPQKIKTAYLVHALIYVPLRRQEEIIGVLGVDHRDPRKDFTQEHVMLVSALANFAAIAIEHARLFSALQTEHDRLNTIITHVGDGVVVLDEKQRVLFINPAAADILNVHAPGQASGRPLAEVSEAPEFLELVNNAARYLPEQEEFRASDGRFFSVRWAKIPGIGLALTLHDISYLKELDRIKSEFVNTVSHDLRSPLTSVMGYTELLERVGPLNDRQREFVQRVQLSVQNITSLINELLDLGKIEAGFDTHREFVDIGPLVQFVTDEMQVVAAKKTQRILVSIEANLPALLANPTRLQQAVENLLGNALKYTPAGGRIEVRVYQEEQQVILQVSDNGPGIPLSDQPYIFDKFYRASNAPQDVPGSGLGLAIVKSIIEAHNGRVWVESYPGEGATFTVVLPTGEDTRKAQSPRNHPAD